MTKDMIEPSDGLDDCREALAMLGDLEDVHLGTPATHDTIARAESLLGFELPSSLKHFASQVGSLSVDGNEVLGLYADEIATDAAVNIVGASLVERPRGLPDRCVVVGNPGNGTRIVVDMEEGGVVRVWTPRSGERGYETYPHFGAYLLELVRDAQAGAKQARFEKRRREQLARLNKGGE